MRLSYGILSPSRTLRRGRTMICPWCGANVAQTKFCENCGGLLEGAADSVPAFDSANAPAADDVNYASPSSSNGGHTAGVFPCSACDGGGWFPAGAIESLPAAISSCQAARVSTWRSTGVPAGVSTRVPTGISRSTRRRGACGRAMVWQDMGHRAVPAVLLAGRARLDVEEDLRLDENREDHRDRCHRIAGHHQRGVFSCVYGQNHTRLRHDQLEHNPLGA